MSCNCDLSALTLGPLLPVLLFVISLGREVDQSLLYNDTNVCVSRQHTRTFDCCMRRQHVAPFVRLERSVLCRPFWPCRSSNAVARAWRIPDAHLSLPPPMCLLAPAHPCVPHAFTSPSPSWPCQLQCRRAHVLLLPWPYARRTVSSAALVDYRRCHSSVCCLRITVLLVRTWPRQMPTNH